MVPRAVAFQRRYAAPAIALALTLFGVFGQAANAVQARVAVGGPRGFDRRRWRALDRWPAAIERGDLFERVRAPLPRERACKRVAAAFFARQLGGLSRRIVGAIDALAMDGSMMAIAAGSAAERDPPSPSTAEGGPAIA